MSDPQHPARALFPGEKPFPVIPACDHYAGTESYMRKALRLQAERGGAFDVTLDLEDGAPTGREHEHADLVVEMLNSDENSVRQAGVRIHDATSPHWKDDLDAVIRGAGAIVSHVTIPKATSARQLAEMITYLQGSCAAAGVRREIPVHALIETHGALREAQAIAALPWMRGLDFGTMDFVSNHHGAIDASAMRSPGQFEHVLVARAKATQVAAALGHGLVPAHGVTLAFRDPLAAEADATRARREFGYLRMWSIHPDQIDPILRAFAPDPSEVALAGRVLLAGHHAHWGPISIDDRLYDRASYRYFWELVRRAHATGIAVGDVAQFFANDA
ncbi:MAG: CoA ester lyase [Planctomycetes bacterium]|nr:CoA ester lyase [Planctomycetota bacterium]